MMWVSAKSYPTWESFAAEAERMGVCKRVREVPRHVTPGVSRVFLIYGEREAYTRKYVRKNRGGRIEATKAYRKPNPRIMGYFIVGRVRTIIDDFDKGKKFVERFKELDPEILWSTQIEDFEARGCGTLQTDAIYLLSDEDMNEVYAASQPLADRIEYRGSLVELKEPIPWPEQTFVGYRYFDASQYGIPPVQAPVAVEKAVSVAGTT